MSDLGQLNDSKPQLRKSIAKTDALTFYALELASASKQARLWYSNCRGSSIQSQRKVLLLHYRQLSRAGKRFARLIGFEKAEIKPNTGMVCDEWIQDLFLISKGLNGYLGRSGMLNGPLD